MTLEQNLEVKKNTIVYLSDVIYFLSKNKSLDLKFNLIFCDPPFKEDLSNKVIEIIHYKKLATKNNIFILHRNKKSREIFPNYFNLIDSYNSNEITFTKSRSFCSTNNFTGTSKACGR